MLGWFLFFSIYMRFFPIFLAHRVLLCSSFVACPKVSFLLRKIGSQESRNGEVMVLVGWLCFLPRKGESHCFFLKLKSVPVSLLSVTVLKIL